MMSLLGGSLVTGACLWLGWSRCNWYGARIRALSQLCCDLERMAAELRERETDTETLLSLLGEEQGITGELYRRCLERLRGGWEDSFAALWSLTLEESRLPLLREEQAVAERVGQVLGRYTGREQADLLSGLARELERFRQTAREEGRQQGRIAVVLGLTTGLTLALVLA